MNEPNWLVEKMREMGPELIGGFVGYFLHEIHHSLFRRPAQLLKRLLRR
jgi:hypothetical protein